MAAKQTPAALLWDKSRQIGGTLPSRAPYPGSDTWRPARWRPITLGEHINFEADPRHLLE